jgi:type IV pilus assembly protein PilV
MKKPSRPVRAHSRRRSSRARGVALVEVLVSLLVIALWLLGSAGMQAGMFKLQKSAGFRLQAMALATELSERMQANAAGAQAGSYAMAANATPSSQTDCTTVHCNAASLAAFDLQQWRARVTGSMDISAVSVTRDTTATLPTYVISISWREPRGRQTYSSAGDTEVASFVITKVVA